MDNLFSVKNKKFRNILRYIYLFSVFVLIVITIATNIGVKENKPYTDVKHIAMYIYKFEELPSNYIHKSLLFTVEGEDLYLYDVFQNNEERLPVGEEYTEVYINAVKDNKGAERLVYTLGKVYYTDDHYLTFDLLEKSEIQSTHNAFLITTLVIIILGSATMAIFIKKNGEISYSIIKEDFKDDFRGMKKVLVNGYDKVKEKILEISE